MSEEITLNIKCSNETKIQTKISPSASVKSLKDKIAAELESTSIPTPANQQRLIFSGRVLKDEEILTTYKIANGNTVHLVRSAPKPASASTPNAPAAESASSTTTASAAVTSPRILESTNPQSTPSTIPATQQPLNPLNPLFGPYGSGVNPFFNPVNTTPGTNPAANPFGGLGGLGALSGFGGGAGGLGSGMDPAMIEALMSNPQVATYMSQLFSNPQVIDTMIQSNPQLAAIMTPEMRSMMQTEEFRRMMSDPNMIRNALAMEQMMNGIGGLGLGGGGLGALGGLGAPPAGGYVNPWSLPATPLAGTTAPTTTPTSEAAGGGAPTTPANAAPPLLNPALLQMLMGAGGAGGAAPGVPTVPPEERFQVQLRQLQDMGFYDARENVHALSMTAGNVEAAVEYLLTHPPAGPR
ncbi:hypothetical protein HK096_010269 [Nowakowskiella sp. JEL0078]|nr:hypothetical protein HK096_010269 [Nowakowskiella sp. JEL0078]